MPTFQPEPSPFDEKPQAIKPLTPEQANQIRKAIEAAPPETQAKVDQHLASALGHDPLKKVSGPSGFRSRAGRPKQQG